MKISELPEPLKSKALEYQKNENKEKDTDNLIDAFRWGKTGEGTPFWGMLASSKQITPEIVKEYYKDAKEVKCLGDGNVFNIEDYSQFIKGGDEIHLGMNGFDICDNSEFVTLYDAEENKLAEIVSYKEKASTSDTQPHYDNTHGSLYKIAEQRGWNSYQFDIVKRIDRALKKGQFDEDLKKTKDLIDLWIKEVNND